MSDRLSTRTRPLPGPVSMGEFRARLAEMADRVLAGEEIIVSRGKEPIARFVPCEPPRRRRPGALRELLGDEAARDLIAALGAPLEEADQRALEGEGTDETGLWTGLSGERPDPDEPASKE